MNSAWLGLAVGLIALNWLAVWFRWEKWNYASKVLIILALQGWLCNTTGLMGRAGWFGAGLAFSLLGDILLLFSVKYFIYGVCAFLMAHLCYLIGFLLPLPPFNISVMAIFLFFFSLCALLYGFIIEALVKNPAFHRLRGPLAVYSIAICCMSASAVVTLLHPDWAPQAAGLAASGAILFFFSDILLAHDRFVQPIRDVRLWKRISYHLGQLAIIAAVVIQQADSINHF